jgi:hypothetical protein
MVFSRTSRRYAIFVDQSKSRPRVNGEEKGITIVPPTEDVAREYKVQYNVDYWGNESSIYAMYGQSSPPSVTSRSILSLRTG